MNKYFFFYPAKIVGGEGSFPETLIPGSPALVLVQGNIYWDTKAHKLRRSNLDEAYSLFYARDNGDRVFLRTMGPSEVPGNDPAKAVVSDDYRELIRGNYIPLIERSIEDPERYAREAAERIDQKRKREAEALLAKEEARQQILAKEEAAYQEARGMFANGEMITWDHFERACRDEGITLPISVKGWGRKWVTKIGTAYYERDERGSKSTVIGMYMGDLAMRLNHLREGSEPKYP